MRKAALAIVLTLLLSLSISPTLLPSTPPGSSAHDAGLGYAPPATTFIYPVGDPETAPTFANSPNGYDITQMFNNSCDPALNQGYYYAGQYFCGHTGVDLSDGQTGGVVHAVANGVVVYAGDNSSYGEMVRIQHLLPDGTYIYSQYEHMLYGSLLVATGQVVTIGQSIGLVGDTGFVFGPHLHFEIKSVNEDGPGYTFGNAALLIGYDDPLAYVASHMASAAPAPTTSVPAPTTAPAITTVAGPAPNAEVATTTPASDSAAITATNSTASDGGEQQGVLNDFYKRYPYYVTVTSNVLGLNVRSGSGYEYPALNSVQKGARLGYLGMTGNGWIHVALPSNVTGYVVREWVAGGPLPQLPPVTMRLPLQPPFVTVQDTRYPARSGPAMHDAAIEALQQGEQLTYLGPVAGSPSWDQVELPTGRVGYVLNWYLSRPPVPPTATAVPANQTRPASLATPPASPPLTGAMAHVSSPPATPAAVTKPAVSSNGPYVITTGDGLNLRAGPRLAAPVIESLPLGTRLLLRGQHVSWVAVTAPDGNEGYVLGSFVRAAPVVEPVTHQEHPHVVAATRPAVRPTYLIVNVRAANLRSAPSLSASVVMSATRGTRLVMRGTQGNWAEVTTPSGATVWIRRDLTR